MIEFQHASKHYLDQSGQKCVALSEVDLQVKEGEIFGIVGQSGAGKSTLLRCVNRLERLSEGRVLVAGECINRLDQTGLRQARRNIGMIFQHFNLLNTATVYDNIALPLHLHGVPQSLWAERLDPLIKLTQLEHKLQAYPAELSGGQKQRVAIARALSTQPKLLLCDEATSALDPHTTATILQLLKDINQQLGVTVLLITHELSVIKFLCDQVALLDQGKIIEKNPVMHFFSKPQTTLAKDLVSTCMESPLPAMIQAQLHTDPSAQSHSLLRIRFNGTLTANPIIARLIQQHDIAINIVQANMEYIKDHALGTMIISMPHAQQYIAQNYLTQHEIRTEALGYVHDAH